MTIESIDHGEDDDIKIPRTGRNLTKWLGWLVFAVMVIGGAWKTWG